MSDPPPPSENPELARRFIWALGGLLVIGVVLVAVTVFGDSGAPGTTSTSTTGSTVVAGDTTSTSASPTTSTTGTSTSTTTTTASTTTETTLADPLAALVLSGQNIGSLVFGDDADGVIAELEEVLGSTDEDSEWVDSFSTFGTCPGTEARLVRWSSLQTFFTDGETEWAPDGVRHFFHYSQSVAAGEGDVLALATAKAIALGDTVADLRSAYGAELTINDDPLFGTQWEVASGGAGILWGSASTAQDDGIVTVISGGFGCGE
jgi:hypothetical protein